MPNEKWQWLYAPVDGYDPKDLNEETIDQYRQNALRFVLRDAARELHLEPEQVEVLARILVARGIAKWQRNRRSFIALKHRLKSRITDLQQQATKAHGNERHRLRGALRELVECREAMRNICHSPRLVLGADYEDAEFVRALMRYAKTDRAEDNHE